MAREAREMRLGNGWVAGSACPNIDDLSQEGM
jgi:hypothetical protein